MKKYPDEKVMVIKTSLLNEIGTFQGLKMEVDSYLDSILSPENNFFMERDDAEEDPSHKQIIPYALFHHEGKFLHYKRGGSSEEKRLVSRGSLGIGGHINSEDSTDASKSSDTYMAGVEREIHEELKLNCGYKQSIVALLNDDSTEVNQVHLGVIHLFQLESNDVQSNESKITDLAFYSPDELEGLRENMEIWSQICLDHLPQLV